MGIQINGQTDTISSTDGSLNIGGTVTVNVTGDATGLTGTPDITVGAVTASSAVISGDLTVNGTTTTLDTTVTEVDRLEVGANNSTVGVAITQSGSGDILRLYDGATQAVTVKDGGNVGIGTDNPGVAGIDILANSAAVRCRESGGADARLVSGGSISYFGTYSNHDLQFLTNGSNALRITSSGNVGIGLTNPNYRLVVAKQDNAVMIQQGTGTLAEMTNNTSQKLWFQGGNAELGLFKNSDGSYEYILGSWQSVTPIPLVFRTGNRVERMRIAYDGNIGIGTESPHAKLEVSGGQNQTANQFTDLVSISANANNDSIAAEVQLNFGISPSHTAEANRKVRIQSITHAGNATPLAINPAGGSVGIGTDNPASLLHLQGSGPRITFTDTAGTDDIGKIFSSSGALYLQQRDGSAHGEIIFRTENSSTAVERLRIDSSGRLLVGTTSYSGNATIVAQGHSGASTGPAHLLLKTGTTSPTSGGDLGYLFFSDANTSGGFGAWILGQRDGGTWTSGSSMPGRLVFSTTADGSSSPTERMRIDRRGYTRLTNDNYTNATRSGGVHHYAHQNLSGDWVMVFENTTSGPFGIIVDYSQSSPNSSGREFFYAEDNVGQRFGLRSNGGLANYSGNNVNLCDEREKKNIVDLDSTWDCLKHWELKKFHYNEDADDSDLRYGVIAQQIAPNCPEVISDWVKQKAEDAVLDEDGNVVTPAKEEILRMAVKEQQMMWMAIKALQEAQTRIETLETANASLEARLTALEG